MLGTPGLWESLWPIARLKTVASVQRCNEYLFLQALYNANSWLVAKQVGEGCCVNAVLF